MISSLSQLDLNKHYTYADYLLWQFKERVELLKGRLKEMKDKFELYQEAGVLEYWVIDPEHDLAFAYHLDDATKKFVSDIPMAALTDEDALTSKVFEGLEIQLKDVFPK